MRECTKIRIKYLGALIGHLDAYDSHGGTRQTKAWIGEWKGTQHEFRNMKEIDAYCRDNGFEWNKVYDCQTPIGSDDRI